MTGGWIRNPTPAALAGGGHICVVVDDDSAYGALAEGFLREAGAAREKAVAFGPRTSPLQTRLLPTAALVADPYVDVLDLKPLDPDRMFAMFREQASNAAAEGYTRLRVAADMDWLLPAVRGPAAALEFEVLLDRVVAELDATVLCAYRRTSFEEDLILGMACAHPMAAGGDEPPFRLVAGEPGTWRLSGEIDFGCVAVLQAALRATVGQPWVIDVADLTFADVAAMRALATVAHAAGNRLELRHASPLLQRLWGLAGFDRVAPAVQLLD